jgi:hypothetical protein
VFMNEMSRRRKGGQKMFIHKKNLVLHIFYHTFFILAHVEITK